MSAALPADETRAECWVLDVGQGSSQVILLPSGGIILIDCGPKHSYLVPRQILQRYKGPIEAFVVTHNDSDHDGAAARLFPEFCSRVKNLFFIHDRPHDDILLWSVVKREEEKKHREWPKERLEWSPRNHCIYADPAHQVFLDVIGPDFKGASENVGDPNAMSGILVLRCGSRRIVFAGDSQTGEWRTINARQHRPVQCDALVVSHHGAELDDMAWLYSQAVKPDYGLISVGSSNRFKKTVHPTPQTVAALLTAGCRILCTQMTPQCCDDLERIRPGLVPPLPPSRSSPIPSATKAGRIKHVGCAGTMVVEIGENRVVVRPYVDQQRAINARTGKPGFHPLCRNQPTVPTPSAISAGPPAPGAG